MNDSPRPLLADGRFAVASVGGTFHGLHVGHRDYLSLAFQLAHIVNVFVTDDNYALLRKKYAVTPAKERIQAVREFAESFKSKTAWRIHQVERPQQVQNFCRTAELDLVVLIPEHLSRFMAINRARRKGGLPEFHILIKPRTRVGGIDVSASSIVHDVMRTALK